MKLSIKFLLVGLSPILLLAREQQHHHPKEARLPAAPAATPIISTDGRCGNGVMCGGGFGPCCSREGFCGNSPQHCAPYTCDRAHGGCDNPYLYRTNLLKSTNGTCGGGTGGPRGGGITCSESGLGQCCSASGQCGSSPGHCGQGCQGDYGNCDRVSTDGTCGRGVTCRFSGFGRCCSRDGVCGSAEEHCGEGCQGGRAGECNDYWAGLGCA